MPRPWLKFLLDSNVVIAVEPFNGALEPSLPVAAELIRLASAQGHLLCVAPATRDDLLQGSNPTRRKQRLAELEKFVELSEVPIPTALALEAGPSAPGTNDHRDLRLLSTLHSSATHYLVTDDYGLRRRAIKAHLSDAVLSLSEAVELLRSFVPQEAVPPPMVSRVPSYTLDLNQSIFDSLKADYSEFHSWMRHVSLDSENRVAFIIKSGDSYAAIALLKNETDCAYPFDGPVIKISTFKVDERHSGVKYGELLLKAIFAHSVDSGGSTLYVEVLPSHPELIMFLGDFGFVDSGHSTTRGERVLCKSLVPPSSSPEDDLSFHIRYGPPALKITGSW